MGKRGRKSQDYALYDGDDFIDLGTVPELSQKHGYTISYLYELRNARSRERTELIIIPLDQEVI